MRASEVILAAQDAVVALPQSSSRRGGRATGYGQDLSRGLTVRRWSAEHYKGRLGSPRPRPPVALSPRPACCSRRPTHYESQACRPSSACPTWPGRRMCGGVHDRPVRRLLTLLAWEARGATVSWCPQPPWRVPARIAAQREAEIYGSAAARKAAFDEPSRAAAPV